MYKYCLQNCRLLDSIKYIICTILVLNNLYELRCQSHFKNDKYFVQYYNYGAKDGLTFGAKDMAIDDLGLLWVQNYDNLAKYNGFKFTYFHPDESDPFARPRSMTDILSDRNKKIWIAADSSIYSYSKLRGFEKNMLCFSGRSFDNITTIHANIDNKIWCGNNEGKIILFDPLTKSNLKTYQLPFTSNINCIYEDILKQIWVSCDLGLYVFPIDGKFREVYNYKNISNKTETKSIKIGEHQNKEITINIENKFLFFDAKKHILNESAFMDTTDNPLQIKDYLKIKDNLYIMATSKGLLFYNCFDKIAYRGSFDSYDEFYFEENLVNKVVLTENGVLLFGTNTGLTKLQYVNEPFKNINLEEETSSVLKYAKEIAAWKNEWLILTSVGNIYRFKKNGRILTKIVKGNQKEIQGATLSYDGNNLYTISDGIIFQYNIDTTKSLNSSLFLYDTKLKNIKIIKTDSLNNIWILDRSGIYSYDITKKNLSKMTVSQEDFFDLEILKNGRICICGKNLYCTENGDLFKLIPINLPSKVNDIEGGKDDDLYFSGFSGLYHYSFSTQRIIRYTIKDGMRSNDAGNLIMIDTNLWITYSSGLQKFHPNSKKFQTYNFEFGLSQNNCYDQKLFGVNHENLILGGDNNFTYYQKTNYSPLKFIDFSLESIIFDGKLIPWDTYNNQKVVVPSTVKLIELKFDFPLFLEPSYFHIEYRLSSDNDTTWHAMSKGMSLNFYELKSNKYQLELRATDVNMPEFKKHYSLSLDVIAPYYQKTGFQILLFLILSSLISLIFYLVYKYKLSQIKKLEMLRMRISRDLHDEMGSELSAIKMLSERELLKSPMDENSSFRKIAETSSTVMENMSDIVWSINPANDQMDKIIEKIQTYAYEILEPKGISVLIDIHDDVNKYSINIEKRRHFYLIFKESINNIAKYAQASEVKIKVFLNGNIVDSTIHDNGIGFYTLSKTQGNGLRNMKERAVLIGGTIDIKSNNQNGTTVHFTFRV
jgi:signal transduction histidine kinase/ligand-binding sensor domain-containing protein